MPSGKILYHPFSQPIETTFVVPLRIEGHSFVINPRLNAVQPQEAQDPQET